MANTTISGLPAATTVAGADLVAVVQGGVTKRATASAVGAAGNRGPSTGRNALTGWWHADGNGVVPGNGPAANVTNLQALLNSIPTSFGSGPSVGGTVFIPEGRYRFNGNVNVPRGVRLVGNGGGRVGTEGISDTVGTALIMEQAGATLLTLSVDPGNLTQNGPTLERLNFYGLAAGSTVRAVYAPNVNRWTVRDCGFKWCGVAVEGDSLAGTVNGGDCSWWLVGNSTFIECGVGVKCTSASGQVDGGDFTDCGTGIDLYGTSAPTKVVAAKFDVGPNGVGIRCRAYNSIFTACYFEITDNSAVGMVVGPDPNVSYSGNDNVVLGCGFYGRGSAPQATGLKILAGANRTRVVAPILALSNGYKVQDAGTNTVQVGVA